MSFWPILKFPYLSLPEIFKWVSDKTLVFGTLHLLYFFFKHRAMSLRLHVVALKKVIDGVMIRQDYTNVEHQNT